MAGHKPSQGRKNVPPGIAAAPWVWVWVCISMLTMRVRCVWLQQQHVRALGAQDLICSVLPGAKELTNHNDNDFNMAQTYKNGHAGLTQRDGATGAPHASYSPADHAHTHASYAPATHACTCPAATRCTTLFVGGRMGHAYAHSWWGGSGVVVAAVAVSAKD